MPDTTTAALPQVDMGRIEDPEVRRALRAMHTEVTNKLAQMQIEIDALLEMMLEKHIGSIGEFRRQLAKLQQNHGKVERLHGAMSSPSGPTPPGPVVRAIPPGGPGNRL